MFGVWGPGETLKKKKENQLGVVVETYNPSYLGSGGWEDSSLRPAWAKSSQDSISTNSWASDGCLSSRLCGKSTFWI
jgi:hypothetical protein